jgi:hypothetical protein
MSRTTAVFRVSIVSSRLADLLIRSPLVGGVAVYLPRLKAFRYQIR